MKSEIKTAKNVTLLYVRLLSNKIGTDETNFAHNLLLTDRQVPRLLEINHGEYKSYQKLSSRK